MLSATSNTVISGLDPSGQHDLLPLHLAFFRIYASSKLLPTCLQDSIPGSWLVITWTGFTPASLCNIAKPQP
ncbi:MAG: hypothetical protein V4525_08105 [Pseudomonadota bacterium]